MNAIFLYSHPKIYQGFMGMMNPLSQEDHMRKGALFSQLINPTDPDITSNTSFDKYLGDLPVSILQQLHDMLLNNKDMSNIVDNKSFDVIDIEREELLSEFLSEIQKMDTNHLQMFIDQLDEIINNKESEGNNQNLMMMIDQFQATLPLVSDEFDHVGMTSSKNHEEIVQQILLRFGILLDDVSSGQKIENIAPKILELLEEWTHLDLRSNNTHSEKHAHMSHVSEDEISDVWNNLLHSYQKRTQLFAKQQYHTEAKVTSKDIARWLNNAITKHSTINENVQMAQVNAVNIPVSNVENYLIHIHQHTGAHSIESQLLDQFQQILRSSQFLTNNDFNQLAITLRPENLGKMIVQLTEVSGEMTLKILVSSQATRQMLEANIHELRNMFSPHQISIEEQEFDLQQIQQHDDDFLEEQSQDQSQHSHQEEKDSSENEFEDQFYELLMNEKV